ncbi:MAG: polysaccharide deacetylase family protein [Burkholderiales bacterium]|nr:polysaccharide deacetylase family protein [Burkholderiales bacterium]
MKQAIRSAPAVSILMYHQVGRFKRPKAHRSLYCDVDRFAAQMAYLKYAGYRVLSLEQARLGLFQEGDLPPRSVVLTFDDGYQNFADYAWPILRRHGFTATVFLVSTALGRQAPWLSQEEAPLMDASTIRMLRAEGASFGSHTRTHRRLSTLSEEEMHDEIFNSRIEIEQLLGEPVPDFCYPYGDYDRRSRDLVIEAGYRTGLTCIRGSANVSDNAYELTRKAISYGDNLVGFFWKLHMKHRRKEQAASTTRVPS